MASAEVEVFNSKWQTHERWSLAMCSWLGVGNDPRDAPTSSFETFPFPRSSAAQRALHAGRYAAEDDG